MQFIVLGLFFIALIPSLVFSDNDFVFEKSWPVQHHAWNFNNPQGIAIDSLGNVFILDTGNSRIQKFSLTGTLVTKWGGVGSADGEFNGCLGIAVDNNGFVYVVDTGNNRIQKFDQNGTFILEWGRYGQNNSQFDQPTGIAIDGNGNVYVADTSNFRIQKFDNQGNFIIKWGSKGSEEGNFNALLDFASVQDIAVDSIGNIYVLDNGNYRVQKFTSQGEFLLSWGTNKSFNVLGRIAISNEDKVYVHDNN